MITLAFPERVTPVSFERCTRNLVLSAAQESWTHLLEDGLTIDLSLTEFAEFSSLAQIALLVEGAARHRIPVEVLVPPRRSYTAERKGIEPAASRLLARANASGFLERCGFYRSLEMRHVPEAERLVVVREKASNSASEDRTNAETDRDTSEQFLLSRIFSLSWFDPTAGPDLLRSERYAKAILGFEELGLSQRDAEGITSTILNELVENVFVHAPETNSSTSCRPFSLVGAMVLDPDRYRIESAQFLPLMQPFVDWASKTGSPIVRIVVGDSGRGIPAVLGPRFDELAENISLPHLELTRTEQVLIWSFNKWSTSAAAMAATKRSTRGLWRVERFVRSYRGLVTVRAADALVSLSYEDSNERTVTRDQYVSYVPGTFVDVYLLPRAIDLPAPRLAALAPRETDLQLVRARGDETSVLSESEQIEIVGHLRRAQIVERCCVLVSVEKRLPTQEQLRAAVSALTDLANHGEVAAIFPRQVWSQLEAQLESVDAYSDEIATRSLPENERTAQEPIRIFDAAGSQRWFGGAPVVRTILNRLSAAPLGRDELRALTTQANGLSELYRSLNDLPDLLEFNQERSSLRLRLAADDINSACISHLSGLLRKAIEGAESTYVLTGVFRTPTLQLVRRWVNAPELVRHSIGFPCLSYALALRLRKLVGPCTRDTIVVFGDASHLELAQALSTSLNLDNPYFLSNTFGSFGRPELARIPTGSKAICCTDVVLTENTVNRIVTDLLRSHIEVIGVVSIVDARPDPREEIVCLGRTIPLVSLVKLDLSIKEEAVKQEDIVDIDPILRTPVTHRGSTLPGPDYDISAAELRQLCAGHAGILCLGHIERLNLRHFSIYLNAGKLLHLPAVKQRILTSFDKQIRLWLNSLPTVTGTRSLEIWYPGPEPFAKTLAEMIRDECPSSRLGGREVSLQAVPRAECFGTWVFPMDVPYRHNPTDVLIVDWGSLTATTTQQLMRLAARAGATSVFALIFLSQMPLDEELFLRQLTGIEAVRLSDSHFNRTQHSQATFPFDTHFASSDDVRHETVPAHVVFLSSLQITFSTPSECPICITRDRYAHDYRECAIDILRQHAGHMASILTEIDREAAFARSDRDLFGSSIAPEELPQIVEWRTQLFNAIRSTSSRQEVRNRLHSLAANPASVEWTALVRLLAAEPRWLNIPPLSFDHLRKTLADIAKRALIDPQVLHDSAFRQELLSVLRDSSKEAFIDSVPEVFRDALDDHELCVQLLYDIFVYLQRPYNSSTEELVTLGRHLHECAEMLQAWDPERRDLDYQLTINALIRACQLRKDILEIGTQDVKEAWRELRESYLTPIDAHADVISAMRIVKLTVDAPIEIFPPDENDWMVSLEQWDKCSSFLTASVLPYLTQLRPLLDGEFYSAKMTPLHHARFKKLMTPSSSDELQRLTQILHRFMKDPQAISNEERRQQCKQEVDWWYRMFLKVNPDGPGAHFLQAVRNCPCDLAQAIEAAKALPGRHSGVFQAEVEGDGSTAVAFCDHDCLGHALEHIIENACSQKHALSNRPEDFVPTIAIQWKSDHGVLAVTIQNDGTEIKGVPGKGLDRIRRDLSAFGAGLTWGPATAPWTFRVQMTLRKW